MSRNLISFVLRVIFAIVAYSILLSQTLLAQEENISSQSNYPPVILKWAEIFDPSALSFEERCQELQWFREAAGAFDGLELRSVAEDIETSFWESQYLARVFREITGIEVRHDVVGEGDVVERLMEQLEHGHHHYDIYVNDADLIGTHLRTRKTVILSDYIQNEGKAYTNPGLDLNDFLNLACGQDYDGNQLQLPNYHFALVYWFRHDWFSDTLVKNDFKKKYGYEIGVPLNWAAYEDIAAFFHGRRMKNPNDSEVVAFGHADYALPGPWLGWRFSDAFLSIAGMGDKGLPNGFPVDEWGIRVENNIPVGASVERGGAINGPAAVYGLTTWLEMLDKYAPPESKQLDWLGLGPVVARGDIAQTWYWCQIYASLNPEYNKIGSPVCDRNGKPVWRIAPIPHGKYWENGMKMGYLDAGSWTIPNTTTGSRRHAAWLWAQFCLSKTVALRKFMVGATPVRKSTLYSDTATQMQDRFGGMIEFLRSPILKTFTDSGPNVPHYPKMSVLWWQNIVTALNHEKTPQQSLDSLAEQFDTLMASIRQERYSPQLNPIRSRQYWLDQPGAPKPERKSRDIPETIQYEELIREWRTATP